MSIEKNKDVYITTPIFYVNDSPHIGHLYSDLVADVIARFYALNGHSVRPQTGTDEHGQKVLKSAEQNGKKAIDFCNEISALFYELAVELNFCASYEKFDGLSNFNLHRDTLNKYSSRPQEDIIHQGSTLFNHGRNFIRTVEGRDLATGEITCDSVKNARHVPAVLDFWKKLDENGWIYQDKYSGWYAIRDEAFYAEDEIVDGKAPTGAEVVWRDEDAYFFRLSEFQDALLEFYRREDILFPLDRKKEILSFVSGESYEDFLKVKKTTGALKDLCVSRVSMDWGIPVEGNEEHKVYVWLDALVNYLSAVSFPEESGVKYWNAAKKIHVIGKDILRFHAVYWPAFLIAYSVKRKSAHKPLSSEDGFDFSSLALSLPDKIVAHGWWTNKGEKISKSLGNVIKPKAEIEFIQSVFGTGFAESVDYLRYFLVSCINVGSDGDYNRDRIADVVQSHLCNNIGNLFNRSLSILRKKWTPAEFFSKKYKIDQQTSDFFTGSIINFEAENVKNLSKELPGLIDNFAFSKIIRIASAIGSRTNHFIEEVAPWKIKSQDEDLFYAIMQVLYLQNIMIAQLLYPIIPTLIGDFFDYLKIDYALRNFSSFWGHDSSEKQDIDDASKRINEAIRTFAPKNTEGLDINILNADVPIFFKKPIESGASRKK